MFFKVLRATFEKWHADNATGMAAALAYYALFSILPLLVIVIAIFGTVIGRSAAQYEVRSQVAGVFGSDVADFVTSLVNAAHFSRSLFLGSFSLLIILFGALTLFSQLRWSLDYIWQAPRRNKERSLWRRALPDTALFLVMAIVGILLVVSAVLSSGAVFLARHFHYLLPPSFDLFLADAAVFFVMGSILFAVLYRYLPNVQLKWRDIRAGALMTSVLFTLGKIVINLYLRYQNAASLYGAASAIIILLLWVYYSAMIFYFGAEFTYVWSGRHAMKEL